MDPSDPTYIFVGGEGRGRGKHARNFPKIMYVAEINFN